MKVTLLNQKILEMKYYRLQIDFPQGSVEILFSANNPIPFDDSWRYNFDMTELQDKFFKIVCGIFAKSYRENGVRFKFSEMNLFHSGW